MEVFQKAKWIGAGVSLQENPTGYLSPALQVRKEFSLSKTENAVCKVCGLGFYQLYINGSEVGCEALKPDFTDYEKRVLFSEYDITSYLRVGKNVVAVKLADGFYNQTTKDTWGFYAAPWRDFVKLVLEISIDEEVVVATEESWRITSNGATFHSAVRSGEYYDARKEDGWRELGYDDSNWEDAKIVDAPKGKLVKSQHPPVRACENLLPISIVESGAGYLVDFGKNISGYVSIEMCGEYGRTLTICYCEKVKDGRPYNDENAQFIEGGEPFATDKYIFSGKGIERWKPQFVYHGFQYVYLSGLKAPPKKDEIIAHFVHTDLEQIGSFHSSNEQLNWIYDAGIRSFLGNYMGFPTDCPHREKNGWTGDAVNSAAYAVFNFDMDTAYQKWIDDIVDSQRENGQLPGIVPTCGWGYDWGSGPAWDCALFVIPYELYLETGKTECLKKAFPAMKKYLEYAKTKQVDGLVKYGLSDWCPPKNIKDLKIMDNRFSDSCYYYYMQKIAVFTAKLFKESVLADEWGKQAENTRSAILKAFVNGDVVDNDSQGALACALYYGLVNGVQAQRIAKKLAKIVEQDEYAFKVGILGVKALLNALCEYGYVDIAYKMINRTEYPSYGFWRLQGATTLWEHWDGSNSHNHHMFGDVLNVISRYIVGLQNAGVRYDECLIEPYLFDENCEAETATQIDGELLSVAWKKTNNYFSMRYEIPKGVQATLKLKNISPIALKTGAHTLNLVLADE